VAYKRWWQKLFHIEQHKTWQLKDLKGV